MTPFRFRQRRTKGWRKPCPEAVCVSHPSRWANPFDWRQDGPIWAVAQYRAVLLGDQDEARRRLRHTIADVRTHLRGRPLGCYCPLDQLCHADVLLEVANASHETGDGADGAPMATTALRAVEQAEHDLHAMAAEGGGNLVFDLVGGPYGGPYAAAALGDPVALHLVRAINGYVERLSGAPSGTTACFLCGGSLHPPHRAPALVVVVYSAAPIPTCVFCSPVCTECCAALPEFGDLQHAIMQRYRTWFPQLTVRHVAEPGHA